MARMIATLEAVAEAAQALLAEGQEPTVILIQEKTGGSFSTVKRHLDTWKRDQAAPPVTPPPAVASAGQQLITQLWQVAAAEIHAAQEAAQTQHAAQLAPLRAQLAEAEQAIRRLEQALETAQAERETAEQAQAAQRQRAERAEAQAQAQAQRSTQLEAQLAQAEQQQHQAHETQLAALQAAMSEQRLLIERLLAQPAAGPEPTAPRRATAKKQP